LDPPIELRNQGTQARQCQHSSACKCRDKSIGTPVALTLFHFPNHNPQSGTKTIQEGSIMAKFYVESGNLRTVISANNSRGAALWAAHRTLSDVLPFVGPDSENPTNENGQPFKLAETVRVSQRGFDRPDCRTYATLDLISEWSQLIVALSRLEHDLIEQPVAATV
jgi:hypothetical protein